MIEAYKKFWLNYTNFDGRSTRSDYWYVVLCNIIINIAIGFIGGILKDVAILGIVLSYGYSLATLIPGIALIVRRLHDINKSGWYYLMSLIPIAGPIIMLVYLCTQSINENNQFGERV